MEEKTACAILRIIAVVIIVMGGIAISMILLNLAMMFLGLDGDSSFHVEFRIHQAMLVPVLTSLLIAAWGFLLYVTAPALAKHIGFTAD